MQSDRLSILGARDLALALMTTSRRSTKDSFILFVVLGLKELQLLLLLLPGLLRQYSSWSSSSIASVSLSTLPPNMESSSSLESEARLALEGLHRCRDFLASSGRTVFQVMESVVMSIFRSRFESSNRIFLLNLSFFCLSSYPSSCKALKLGHRWSGTSSLRPLPFLSRFLANVRTSSLSRYESNLTNTSSLTEFFIRCSSRLLPDAAPPARRTSIFSPAACCWSSLISLTRKFRVF